MPEFSGCKIEKERKTKRENNFWFQELFGQGLHALYVYRSQPSGSFISLDYFHVTRMCIINEQFMAMLFLCYRSAHLAQKLNNSNNRNIKY